MKFFRFIDALENETRASEANRALLRTLSEKRDRVVAIQQEESRLRMERERLRNDIAALEARAARIRFREGKVA